MRRRSLRSSVSRRALLSTFAGLGAATCFRGLLRDAFARDAPPQRFVLLWNPHGYAPELWRPRAADGGAALEKDWVLDFDPDASLGPLEPHKDSLVIVDGLDFSCNYQDEDWPLAASHDSAKVAAITGRRPRAASDQLRTDGPSLDHVIAKTQATRPFHFKPRGYPLNFTSISYDDAGEELPFEYDLTASLRDWFGVGPRAQLAEAEVDAETAVLKFLQADAQRLRSRLAAPEQQKLDAHLEGMRLLEQRLKRPTPANCAAPASREPDLFDPSYLRTVMDFSLRLLECGLTECVTLNLDVGESMPWLGFGDLKTHDDIAHGYRADDPVTVRRLAKVQRWYASQVAYFVEGLKAIPDGSGSLYDSTVILWASEFGDPAGHVQTQTPFVVAGGGGAHRKGRFLELGTGAEYTAPSRPHNHLLTSVGNLFGLELPGFGDARLPGELSGFLG
jgi:Protein of unknown function (DUF1552)